jgi:hypothetical protein
MGRALSAYSKPIIATAEPQQRNIALFMRIQFSDHTGRQLVPGEHQDATVNKKNPAAPARSPYPQD